MTHHAGRFDMTFIPTGPSCSRSWGVMVNGLAKKNGKDDLRDTIPLHPFVLAMLRQRTIEADTRVLKSVPDMKTMKRDLERAGVTMVDAKGRRLDFHALRHTFVTNLDRTGCSRATKKKLMRHATGDVTHNYTHAEAAEMFAALRRLPTPGMPEQPANKPAESGDQGEDQTHRFGVHSVALGGTNVMSRMTLVVPEGFDANNAFDTTWHAYAPTCLNVTVTADIVENLRPSTQVD